MHAFDSEGLMAEAEHRREPYFEFLRVPAMSAGVYRLPRGGKDTQSPHGEDEAYYVLRGRARIRVGAEDGEVRNGSVVYVPARINHRFYDIEEDLALLVVFAPAEASGNGGRRS